MTSALANRSARIKGSLRAAEVDALIVSSATNIQYIAGFTGSNGTVVVCPDHITLVTDARYTEWAHEEVAAHDPDVAIVIASGNGAAALDKLVESASSIGLESDDLSWAQALFFTERFGKKRVVATSGVIEALREIKDEREISALRSAAAIADSALETLVETLAPGPTEAEVARQLAQLMYEHGAAVPSFDIIVASGKNAARPHHTPGQRHLATGDLLIIDCGAVTDGYRSDMTRSFVFGTPSAQQQEMLEAVRVAQQAGVDAVAPGVAASAIDTACRVALADSGLDVYFTHGTGHGVGLDIHEAPSVSGTSTATLSAGHIITVEPGVYIPDVGGVRWEDTVVVQQSGADPLTRSPKQPFLVL